MRIGILTYHRSQNYGAQIQVLAMKSYLEFLGCEVYVVDYWPEYHKSLYEKSYFTKDNFKRFLLSGKVKYFCRATALSILSYIRRCKTNYFAAKHLNVVSADFEFDVLIYGSDQIWRKQHVDSCESYNPIYLGDGRIKACYRMSYAASMGKIEADENDVVFLKEKLKQFNALSVREKDLQVFMEVKLGIKPKLVCDPTLLLAREHWNALLPNKNTCVNKYIFMYNLVGVSEVSKAAERLSKSTGMPVVEYRGYVDKVSFTSKCRVTASAEDFLYKIRDAEFVVTSSFHGVALSLCFEKQFYFASIDELSNRTESLLSIVNLESRNISKKSMEDVDWENQIDYNKVNSCLEDYRSTSRTWLCECLDKYNL